MKRVVMLVGVHRSAAMACAPVRPRVWQDARVYPGGTRARGE